MHVGDLLGSSTSARSKWEALVVITVHNQAELPLAGVLVTGTWSAGGEAACVTGADGTCFVIKNNLKTSVTSIDFSITDLSLNGYTYNSNDNHDDGGSDGTVITVYAP